MAISKTKFINYTRCPRYASLEKIKKEKLAADISYNDYKDEEKEENIKEIVGSMYEIDEETGQETDLVDKVNQQLEAMMDYYKLVEIEAGRISKKIFGGKSIYAEDTKDQKCFSFTMHGIKYICYVDIFNENKDFVNIIEVKATTSKKYKELASGYKKSNKYSIWECINNINYLKGEIPEFDLESQMPLEKYNEQRNKLFDRFNLGQYVYDLAVQRYFIEHEYESNNLEEKLKNFHYYLAVLNEDYIFDGTYIDGKPIYNPDSFNNELITFFDMTKVSEEYQKYIEMDHKKLEGYLEHLEVTSCPLGKYCGIKKQSACKFFTPICGKMIPEKNSSLSYVHNGFGFLKEDGKRIKGLELINEGYLNLMDIPDGWIKNKSHFIQRECYLSNKAYIDKDKIRDGLKQIKYPIYHLDFETMPCPVPRFKGEWPYIQSPFEFSLHIERKPGVCDKDKDNVVFLAKTHQDEREEMIKLMLKYINPNEGTLFAQNVSFEKGRIKELARMFPKYHDELMKIYERGFDLLWLVNTNSKMYMDLGYDEERAKTFNFYDKRLSGSFSIKKTLPVFSDLKYDDLVVKNGTEAIVFYANYEKMSKEEFELNYQALITYCKQDTWAMVEILNGLRKLVK
jgi:hypothetical protein